MHPCISWITLTMLTTAQAAPPAGGSAPDPANNAGAAPTAGTIVAGVTTAGGSTATTGDVRGTYDPNAACDGSKVFELILALPLVPRHEHCPQPLPMSAGDLDGPAEGDSQHAFASLAGLLRKTPGQPD